MYMFGVVQCCVCECVCMCECVCVCVHVYMCTHACLCMCVHVCTYICRLCLCISNDVYTVYMSVCIWCACVCVAFCVVWPNFRVGRCLVTGNHPIIRPSSGAGDYNCHSVVPFSTCNATTALIWTPANTE